MLPSPLSAWCLSLPLQISVLPSLHRKSFPNFSVWSDVPLRASDRTLDHPYGIVTLQLTSEGFMLWLMFGSPKLSRVGILSLYSKCCCQQLAQCLTESKSLTVTVNWVGSWMDGWMPLLCFKCFSYPPFKVSSNSTSCRKPFLIFLVGEFFLLFHICSACNSATVSVAFYLLPVTVFTAVVPMVCVFPEIQDQSCSSSHLSLGMVPWTWGVLSKYWGDWFLYVVQVILTLTMIQPQNMTS